MSRSSPRSSELQLVAAQLGRVPRDPWRVGGRCSLGYPSVIVSPATLDDGSPFPSLAWLTCPWLLSRIGEMESAGQIAVWSGRAARDSSLAAALRAADAEVRSRRADEGGGYDACDDVGIAGQRDPLGVKCLHAHVALALLGVADPIGKSVLGKIGFTCPDERCARLVAQANEKECG